jgi:hypothetical protein
MIAIRRSIESRSRARSRHAPAASVAKTLALLLHSNVVADLHFLDAVDLLHGEATVADDDPVVGLGDHPQPEAVVRMKAVVPLDPSLCFSERLRSRVIGHHPLIAKERLHVVQVGGVLSRSVRRSVVATGMPSNLAATASALQPTSSPRTGTVLARSVRYLRPWRRSRPGPVLSIGLGERAAVASDSASESARQCRIRQFQVRPIRRAHDRSSWHGVRCPWRKM